MAGRTYSTSSRSSRCELRRPISSPWSPPSKSRLPGSPWPTFALRSSIPTTPCSTPTERSRAHANGSYRRASQTTTTRGSSPGSHACGAWPHERPPLHRLADLAAGRLHGATAPPTEAERLEALRIARPVVKAFVDYLTAQGSREEPLARPNSPPGESRSAESWSFSRSFHQGNSQEGRRPGRRDSRPDLQGRYCTPLRGRSRTDYGSGGWGSNPSRRAPFGSTSIIARPERLGVCVTVLAVSVATAMPGSAG
jgi:hypothetical protein